MSLSCILVPSLCLRGESSRQALSASLYKLVPRQQKQLNLFLPSVHSPLKTAPLTKPTGSIVGMNRMAASLYMTGTKALKKKLSKPMPHLLSRENLGCYCGDKTGNRLNERKTLKSWFTKHRKKKTKKEKVGAQQNMQEMGKVKGQW